MWKKGIYSPNPDKYAKITTLRTESKNRAYPQIGIATIVNFRSLMNHT